MMVEFEWPHSGPVTRIMEGQFLELLHPPNADKREITGQLVREIFNQLAWRFDDLSKKLEHGRNEADVRRIASLGIPFTQAEPGSDHDVFLTKLASVLQADQSALSKAFGRAVGRVINDFTDGRKNPILQAYCAAVDRLSDEVWGADRTLPSPGILDEDTEAFAHHTFRFAFQALPIAAQLVKHEPARIAFMNTGRRALLNSLSEMKSLTLKEAFRRSETASKALQGRMQKRKKPHF